MYIYIHIYTYLYTYIYIYILTLSAFCINVKFTLIVQGDFFFLSH